MAISERDIDTNVVIRELDVVIGGYSLMMDVTILKKCVVKYAILPFL